MLKKALAAVALALAIGPVWAFQGAAPSAQPPGATMRRGGRNGAITAIAGTVYTIKTMRGVEVKADIAKDVPITRLDRSTGTIADLKVGTFVNVTGEAGPEGIIKATSVRIQYPAIVGTIQAISAKRVTIRTADGKSSTYLITDKTAMRNRRQAATWASFKSGDPVTVQYSGAAAMAINYGMAVRPGGARRTPSSASGTAGAPPSETVQPGR